MIKKYRGRRFALKAGMYLGTLLAGFFGLTLPAKAQTRDSLEFSVKAYNSLLSNLPAGQTTVRIGDMQYATAQIAGWRDRLQAKLDGKIIAEGGFDFASSKPWTSGVLPYVYDKSMPAAERTLFESAIREWQVNASLNFVPWSGQANYLLIKFTGYSSKANMDSFVGMLGGAQVINVAGWGNKIDCAHELGHALGLTHEQCRSDRDSYVTILKTNLTVDPATDVNYAIAPKSINRTAYDYDSLMHYPRDAMAKDPSFPTMLAKSPNEKWSDGLGPDEIGQTTHLSVGDKSSMAAEYGSPLQIGGTIKDAAGHPLAGVQVTLSGGSTYRGSNPISTAADGTYAFAGIPKNSGTYTVTPNQPGTSFTQGTRTAQLQTSSQSAVDFTSVDSAPPDLIIDVPAVSGVYSTAPAVSGKANDSVALKEVRVALARTSDLVWWNWNDNTWGTTTFDWAKNVRIATGKSSWSTSLPNLSVGGYQVHVQSVDTSDNASPWLFRHFFVDPEPPVVAVAQPIPNSTISELDTIRGTATDGAGTGIKDNRVYFTLYQNGDFWTGFNWKSNTDAQDPDVLLYADVVDGQWIYNAVPGHNHDDEHPSGSAVRSGTYYISLFARDNAGNLSTPTPGVNSVQFTVDNSPPSVAITAPETGSVVTNLTSITGSATDAKTLASVRLYLFRYSDGQFWDGTAWGGGGSAILPVSIDLQNGTWTSTGPLPSVNSRNPADKLSNGGYDIIAFAVDSAGNQTRIDSVITVEYFPQFTYTAGSYSDSDPNNNNENWDNPANWSPFGIPGTDDLAVIPSGSPIFSGTKALHGLRLAGGTVRGGSIIISAGGLMVWSNGTLSADLTIDPGAELAITGSDAKTISTGKRVEINGESHWDGASTINGSGGVVFRNNGSITADGDITFVYYNNGVSPVGVLENFGTLAKQGTGTLRFAPDYNGWALTNAGTINVTGGSIILNNTTYLGGTISGAGHVINDGGSLHLDGTATLDGGTVELKSGSIDGEGTFTGSGTFEWSGGTAKGDILIDAATHFTLTGGDKTIATGARIRNAGHATWDSGSLLTSGNSRFDNSGTFDMNGSVVASYYNNGVSPRGEFINSGVINKTTTNSVVFASDYGGLHLNNLGQLNVLDGVLKLGGGGISTNAIYSVQPGALLDLNSGEPHVLNGSIQVTGGGRMRIAGGSVSGDATIQITAGTTLEHNTGNVTGTYTVSGPGTFEWSGGSLNAAMTWDASLQTLISGNAEKNLDAGNITQNGTVQWTGSGGIHALGHGRFENNGTFSMLNDSAFVYYNNGVYPGPIFINNGTFRKSSSTGVTLFSGDYGGWALTNHGTIDIQSGELDLNINASFGDGGTFTGAGSTRIVGNTSTLYGTSTVDGGIVELSNGTLTSASGLITGNGTVRWTGGNVSGTVSVGVTNFSIEGSSDKSMSSSAVLRNTGTAIWSGAGAIRTVGANVFENKGRFEARSDATLFYYNNGVYPKASFTNSGTFVKSGGTNTLFSADYGGAAFDNTGTILVQSGTLTLSGGGLWSAGSVQSASPAEVRLAAGTFQLTNSTSFDGFTRVTGGQLALQSSTNSISGTLLLESGSITGTGGFSGTGTFGWNGGTISADLNIAPGMHWLIDGDAEKLFNTGVIDNYGTAVWSGTGPLKAQGAAVLNNYNSFTLRSDSGFLYYNNGVYPRPRFNNFGTLAKDTTAGASTFIGDYGGWEFANTGILQINSGVLALTTSDFLTNSIIRGAGRVRIEGGSAALGGTTTLDGTLELAGGSITGESTFTGPGTLQWSGGDLNGTHTIAAAGKLLLSGGLDKNIAGASTLINEGLIDWTGSGNIHGVGQSHLVNHGTILAESDAGFLYYNNGVYPGALFENTGVIRKAGSFGRTVLIGDYGGWKFSNSGLLDIQNGSFDVGPQYEPSANAQYHVVIGGPIPGTNYSLVVFSGRANFNGKLAVTLTNNFIPLTNTVFTIASFTARNANEQFVSPALPVLKGGMQWNVAYDDTSLRLSVSAGASNSNPARTADGKFQMSLSGPAGQYAILQGSSNLVDWLDIQTNKPFTGEFIFSDPNATNGSKFYRTVIVP
jgi:hypothetical protein